MTLTNILNVLYSIHGQEKEIRFDYIPEEISVDGIKLNNYLKEQIAKQEHVEEDEISISGVYLPHSKLIDLANQI